MPRTYYLMLADLSGMTTCQRDAGSSLTSTNSGRELRVQNDARDKGKSLLVNRRGITLHYIAHIDEGHQVDPQ